jgi:putative tributyrin esterase
VKYILEIYNYAHQVLPVSKKREDNFIAGHSMGGYGTIKFALTQSHLFSKAAPLSAVFDVQSLLDIEWNDFDPKVLEVLRLYQPLHPLSDRYLTLYL